MGDPSRWNGRAHSLSAAALRAIAIKSPQAGLTLALDIRPRMRYGHPPTPPPNLAGMGGGWVPLQSSQRSPPRGPLPRPRRQLALQAQPFPKAIAEVYGGDLVEEVDDNPEELAPLRPARGGARGEEVGGGGVDPPLRVWSRASGRPLLGSLHVWICLPS